jgi:hypothetical protein
MTKCWRTAEGLRLDRYSDEPRVFLRERDERAVLWLDGGRVQSGPIVGWLAREDYGDAVPVTVMFGRDDDPDVLPPEPFDWAVLKADGRVMSEIYGFRDPHGRWLPRDELGGCFWTWPSAVAWAKRNDPAANGRKKARAEKQRAYRAKLKVEEEEANIASGWWVRCPGCGLAYGPERDREWQRWRHDKIVGKRGGLLADDPGPDERDMVGPDGETRVNTGA